jgi:hypothetical protein
LKLREFSVFELYTWAPLIDLAKLLNA